MPELNSGTLGKFCRELAGGLSPLPTLLTEWSLTPTDYQRLQSSEGFAHEMSVIVREMREMGADAGYIYRMKSLSEEFIVEILRIMKSPDTPVSTRVELIKFTAEMARLKEKSAVRGEDVGPRGPSVVFHFGAGLPINSLTVTPAAIDVQPTITSPTSVESYGFDIVPE